MRRALELAARALYTTHPNPRVGAVLALDNEIVGEGWHERPGEAHAEPNAIRAARAAGYSAARIEISNANRIAPIQRYGGIEKKSTNEAPCGLSTKR